MRRAAVLGCALVAACAVAQPTRPFAPSTSTGPERGTLFLAGGGSLNADLVDRFVQLAGGDDARIVIIPTAATEDSFPADWPGLRMFRDAGARHLTLLHTRSRDTADSEAFTRAIRSATAVWLSGGRQWRLTDAYLGTRTVNEIRALLDRGGVVGGTSAGASIQASYMVRGAVESNEIMMAPGYEEGFGLLRNTAVDQHLTARGRQDDMLAVVQRHPALLGIGIDEGTAIIVSGDRAEVMGEGRVAFYNTRDGGDLDYYFLTDGGSFDLDRRVAVSGRRVAPQVVRDEADVLAAMYRLFDAMRTRDTAAIRALAHPDLHTFIPIENNGRDDIRSASLNDFIAQVAASTERLDERPLRPEVRIDGRLAFVWTFYEFVIGSDFSHCGTDAFTFVKDNNGWVITGLAYTIQRDGCTR